MLGGQGSARLRALFSELKVKQRVRLVLLIISERESNTMGIKENARKQTVTRYLLTSSLGNKTTIHCKSNLQNGIVLFVRTFLFGVLPSFSYYPIYAKPDHLRAYLICQPRWSTVSLLFWDRVWLFSQVPQCICHFYHSSLLCINMCLF